MCLKSWENAYVERVNGTIKNDYLRYRRIDSLKSLRKLSGFAVGLPALEVKVSIEGIMLCRLLRHLQKLWRFLPEYGVKCRVLDWQCSGLFQIRGSSA